MRGGGLTPGILAGSALLSASCEQPLCRSEPFLAFSTTWISGDVDDFAPGVQTNVDVESSLLAGDHVTLEVLDESGASLDTMSRTVDTGGGARFEFVTLPVPRAVLRASGRGICGTAHAEVMVDVPVAATCELAVAPAPETAAYYAPFGVLNLHSDPDPLTPGYQTTVRVASRPGWVVDIMRTAAGSSGERPVGMFIAGGDGMTSAPVTLPDGWVTFRAICRGDGRELVAPTMTLLADTTAPSCALVSPAPGSTVKDDDHDLGNGVQMTLTGRSGDPDVSGEPVNVTMIDGRGAVAATMAMTADDKGIASGQVTLVPASLPARYQVMFTMRDHAGNACTAVGAYTVAR